MFKLNPGIAFALGIVVGLFWGLWAAARVMDSVAIDAYTLKSMEAFTKAHPEVNIFHCDKLTRQDGAVVGCGMEIRL